MTTLDTRITARRRVRTVHPAPRDRRYEAPPSSGHGDVAAPEASGPLSPAQEDEPEVEGTREEEGGSGDGTERRHPCPGAVRGEGQRPETAKETHDGATGWKEQAGANRTTVAPSPSAGSAPSSPRSSRESVALHREPGVDREALKAALRRIPPRRRRVLLLHFFAGRSHAEVAESVGTTQREVEDMLRRALGELHVELTPASGEGAA
ncbi:sigma-70 family RNA polymerase sigma factor [Marinactinospora thermotolerans]|uniref:RNA polymerase sigma factor, sigma-70 family n=1 Tax=Marinactinospora thermotolerans DSM 45154 TaxID=1122192 RepID=A0A1T4P5A0_9ACTN|nr:sigma-70 family RNA polymerase sigma factor [Marinactinospora thermotolerans]SJZ86108.1 RNA polymerase sigma factor, sigma-70 family [Marinactinospora thermotolerans DSM 45154]